MNCCRLANLPKHRQQGLTLTEVVISLGLGGLMFGGVLTGYLQSATQAEWSAYNLAGHSLAMQRLEAVRASKWDTQAAPPVDLLVGANFPESEEVLDVPLAGTNRVFATSRVTISTISANPPIKLIRVETAWPFRNQQFYTNTVATYRAPDQ